MSGARTCPNCGAGVARERARFCEYCGTELPKPERTPVQPVVVSPFGDKEQRFAALSAHERLDALMRHRPSSAGAAAGMAFGLGFAIVFTAISAVITVMFALAAGPCAAFPLLFVLLGVGLIVVTMKKGADFASSKTEPRPALVLDERTAVSGGENTSTRYYLTLEFPDGERSEFEVKGSLSGELTTGDMGIAYTRSDVLLDFQRVAV